MRRVLLGLLLFFFAALAGAQAPLSIVPPPAHVVDQTATLSAEQRARLDSRLAAFEREKGAQIAVLIVASVAPESIEAYALRVAESWRLGRSSVDDGALLLVAKNDRKLRIEVGYGLEGALPDAVAKRIISETIAPRFGRGDFYGGIEAGVDAMMRVVGGENLPPPRAQAARKSGSGTGIDLETLAFAGFALVFVVGGVLRALFGRFFAAAIVAGVAGAAVALFLSSLLLGVVAALVAFVAALFAGTGGGRGWGGGAPWGGGGGGFSGGGFSGGGGRFGGGGASGGW